MIGEVTQALVDHLIARTADLGPDWIEVASLDAEATLTEDRLQVCLYAVDQQSEVGNTPTAHTPVGQDDALWHYA